MGVSMIEFCTPPIPGQSHEFYGNVHNNFIKLPASAITTPKPNKLNKLNALNNTTLNSIVNSGNLSLLNALLSGILEPEKTINTPHSITGLAPLHLASSRGHLEMVENLIEKHSAIIDLKDKEGETALLKAAYNGHLELVKYLISKDANIHIKDNDGWTALHNACARGYLDICQLLIEAGAHVDVKSKMGHTPLINAASKGYISIVEYLLNDAHANPLIKNNFGETAYDVSAAANESFICNLVYKAGLSWWQMQYGTAKEYNLLDYHVTVMIVLHENERSSSLLGFSKPYFSSNSLTKNDTRGPWSLASKPCTKDQVQLPQQLNSSHTDWFWLTDWQVDGHDPQTDDLGWSYARHFDDPDDQWVGIAPTSGYGWVRRRKWTRIMKRRMDLTNGNHMGYSEQQQDNYLCDAEDIVQNSKLDITLENQKHSTSLQQLTTEVRALEEAVQLLRAGIKNDKNQFRINQAKQLLTIYTSQIDIFNTKISTLAEAVSTPITPKPVRRNPELEQELGFAQRQQEGSDFDSNPWSRDSVNKPWEPANVLETVDFDHPDLNGFARDTTHGLEISDIVEEESEEIFSWESDVNVKECKGCQRKFGLLVRKHHCRCCGLIHCDRCSTSRVYLDAHKILQDPNNPVPIDTLVSKNQRVCDSCYKKIVTP